jgi:hypothetical protein
MTRHILVEIEVAERDSLYTLDDVTLQRSIQAALEAADDRWPRGTRYFHNVRVLTEEDPL